jgi:hypothetical protein
MTIRASDGAATGTGFVLYFSSSSSDATNPVAVTYPDLLLVSFHRVFSIFLMDQTTEEFSLLDFEEFSLYWLGRTLRQGAIKVWMEFTRSRLKVNFSLCLTKHHAMKAYWGVEV